MPYSKEYVEKCVRKVCMQCGKRFKTIYERNVCEECNSEAGVVNRNLPPLPSPIEHPEPRPLKDIGTKCPYCGGTTGFSSNRKVLFCYSCDYAWTIFRQPIGVIANIGLV
jgi:hypothetical protein